MPEQNIITLLLILAKLADETCSNIITLQCQSSKIFACFDLDYSTDRLSIAAMIHITDNNLSVKTGNQEFLLGAIQQVLKQMNVVFVLLPIITV